MSIDNFFAESDLSKASKKKYRWILELFLEKVDPATCTSSSVINWLDSVKTWGDSSRWVALVAVRCYLRWLDAKHPALSVKEKRGKPKPVEPLTPAQLRALVQSFDTSKPTGKRNIAIVYLAIDTGFRVAELTNLLVKDVDFTKRIALVPVKGGEWGRGLFSMQTAYMLDAWMSCREENDPRLFQITCDGLRATVDRWGQKLGFHLHTHLFKHSGATFATRQGSPTRVLQEAFRWSRLDMAERYTDSITAEDFEPYFGTNILL